MDWKRDGRPFLFLLLFFLGAFFMPLESGRFGSAVLESLILLKLYAREHVLTCLIPAFFIAGGISVFLSQAAVMRYLGAQARKVVAYTVASVSGSVLAVCSCTVLPLFAGIYRMGAGIGPASAFLYSGPAINILAIIMTARVLGLEIGIARATGAVLFSIVIGLLMHLFFSKTDAERTAAAQAAPDEAGIVDCTHDGSRRFYSLKASCVPGFLDCVEDILEEGTGICTREFLRKKEAKT